MTKWIKADTKREWELTLKIMSKNKQDLVDIYKRLESSKADIIVDTAKLTDPEGIPDWDWD